jgi:hypothetical protein
MTNRTLIVPAHQAELKGDGPVAVTAHLLRARLADLG